MPANDAGFSQGDVLSAVALFMAVLGRHDGIADGATEEQKAVIEARLTDVANSAAVLESLDPTLPLDAPWCAT